MKIKSATLLIVSLSLVLVQCKTVKKIVAVKPVLEKINADEVSLSQIDFAYESGKRVLITCNTSVFKTFTSKEATQDIIKKMTQEKISSTCQIILRSFGEFKDLEFIEAIRNNQTNEVIYRFKCIYEKKYYEKELQVSLNEKLKISGIKTKKWSETFEYIP